MTQVNKVVERELDWNDEIADEGGEFIILQPGDYDFTVKGFERSRFNGSDKMPSCPMAIVDVAIVDPATGKEVVVKNRLFLHTRTEWTISQFFTGLGLKEEGVPFRPNWTEIVGKNGRLKLKNREYNGEIYNEIEKFYPKEKTGTQSIYDF